MIENLENEIWKDIPDFKGYYQASNMGRIKSLYRVIMRKTVWGERKMPVKEKIITNYKSNNTYLMCHVNLGKDFRKNLLVHRLIATTFLPNNENKRTVNHINGNKHDNRVENLEWNTHSENHIHAFSLGLHQIGSKRHNSVLNEETATKIKKLKAKGWRNVDIASELKVKIHNVSSVVNNQNWKHIII